MSVTYQAVRSAPTEAIVNLYRGAGWWKEEEGPAWRDIIPRMIQGSFRFMVAQDAERLVGMARAVSDGISDAYIQDVTVLPEYRGQGIGRELVRRITEQCIEAKIGWIGLVAEPGSQGFYEALGYGALVNYQPMLFGHAPGGAK